MTDNSLLQPPPPTNTFSQSHTRLPSVIAVKEGAHRIYDLLRTSGWEKDEVQAELLTEAEIAAAARSASNRAPHNGGLSSAVTPALSDELAVPQPQKGVECPREDNSSSSNRERSSEASSAAGSKNSNSLESAVDSRAAATPAVSDDRAGWQKHAKDAIAADVRRISGRYGADVATKMERAGATTETETKSTRRRSSLARVSDFVFGAQEPVYAQQQPYGHNSSPPQQRPWKPHQWGQPAIPVMSAASPSYATPPHFSSAHATSPSFSSTYVAPAAQLSSSGMLQAAAAADQQMTVALSMNEHFGFEPYSAGSFFGITYIYPGSQAQRLGIEAGAEIKAINTWHVTNQGEYDEALAKACQVARPRTINITVTIPQDE